MSTNIGHWLSKRALLSPNREAYVDGLSLTRLSFEELNNQTCKLANAFLAHGVKKEERIALLLGNCSEFVESYFALAKIGAVVVPLNWRLVADELEFILKDSGATRLIYDDSFLSVVEDLESRGGKTDIQHWIQVSHNTPIANFAEDYELFRDQGTAAEPNLDVGDDDLLYIMYTSGTTGLPKGVVHTHNTVAWAIFTFMGTFYLHEKDRYFSPMPMFHVGALIPLTLMVYKGITSVVMHSFDPLKAWHLIEQERATFGLLVPAMLNFMLQVGDVQRFDCSSLRMILTGAAPVPDALIEEFGNLGIPVVIVYGLTESCGPATASNQENTQRKIGSAGKPFFHTDVRIVRSDGSECNANESGEVLVRGNHIMLEYWNRPEATSETIVNGWLHTGDVALKDEEGFIYIQDRIKDMIISGGENIYPAEIENSLQEHPYIGESAVIGQPSEKWGESPLAIVVRTNENLTESDVLSFLQSKIARYKLPYGVVFVDAIPRNPSGKILKWVLREKYPGPAFN
ncbi:MAG: long-chain-fatty-acid--CoA ligase [Gammaproteobacteria bacterium]|nr:long-chain-fatty-acid--CoA ligase [Gammaproteobacteria bacterium]